MCGVNPHLYFEGDNMNLDELWNDIVKLLDSMTKEELDELYQEALLHCSNESDYDEYGA